MSSWNCLKLPLSNLTNKSKISLYHFKFFFTIFNKRIVNVNYFSYLHECKQRVGIGVHYNKYSFIMCGIFLGTVLAIIKVKNIMDYSENGIHTFLAYQILQIIYTTIL